jgi:hypothetical protein
MVARNLTLRYDRMMLLLGPAPLARELAGKEGRVGELPGRAVCCPTSRCCAAVPGVGLDPDGGAAAIVENKQLGAALAFARALQASYPPNRRRGDPRRQRPPNNLEAPGRPTKIRPSRKVLAAAAVE